MTAPWNPAFDPVLFIQDGTPVNLDPKLPWMYNNDGQTEQVAQPKGEVVPILPDDPSLSRGRRYTGITWKERTINEGTEWAYTLTEFDFKTGGKPVEYEGMWADRDTCRAFGITYVKSGQCIPFQYDGMIKSQYTYGVFAGYQSPYIEKDKRRQLLTINATDLEYHAFPHIFASQVSLPLVISVARWRPEAKEIWLADLYVNNGDCLFLPPKQYQERYVDMHGNRNSAYACWGLLGLDSLQTETTLGNAAVFDAPATKPHYHAEPCPTVHLKPS